MKNIRVFVSENFQFLEMKFLMYLNRRVFVMNNNNKHCDEIKQRAQWRSEARTQENHKQDHSEPDHRH